MTPPPRRSARNGSEGAAHSPGTKKGRSLRARLVLLGAAVLCLFLTACMGGPQSSLQASGSYARSADRLFEGVFIIVAIVFVLVEGAIVVFLIKYRERDPNDLPVQVHGHTRAEVIWTVIPAVILAGVAIPTVKMIFDFARVPPKADRVDVCITGHQWWWEYQYVKDPGDACPAQGLPSNDVAVTTANELVLPTHKSIYLTLNSIDVIHAFWVPQLNGKQDVVPGHTNHMTIEADNPGTYYGQCSQYCGTSHANMRLRAVALTPDAYQSWLSQQAQPAVTPTATDAQAGADLFVNGRNNTGVFASKGQPACSNCHAIDGTTAAGQKGPNLTHVFTRQAFAGDTFDMNPENLKLWLEDPPKMKPGVDMPNLGLTPQEVNDLVAYLETLK
ncbi:MAG TPA: cytochrome c oxidase subunit II [Actinomycetota bacterium]|nr:cytochrome c oxidase subunit II [Actinomycetota bacterium]